MYSRACSLVVERCYVPYRALLWYGISDPPALTSPKRKYSSVVERRPDKTEAVGSIPTTCIITRQDEVGRGKTEVLGPIPSTRIYLQDEGAGSVSCTKAKLMVRRGGGIGRRASFRS